MNESTATIGGSIPEVTEESILEAIKIIASTKPLPVAPYSIGMVGGVKIISNPNLQDDQIIVSDNIYGLLRELAPYNDGDG